MGGIDSCGSAAKTHENVVRMCAIKKLHDYLFMITFGLLASHELDAVRCAEWRVLPMTRFLPDDIGMSVFIIAHVPMFAWLSECCWSEDIRRRVKARRIFAGFSCLHVLLHWLFRNDSKYAFSGWLSNGLIIGAGVFGALFLLISRRREVVH
jgi:hypothetical protein